MSPKVNSLPKLVFTVIFVLSLAVWFTGCASAKKKGDLPKLSKLHGKRVALVELEGENTAKRIVEVALVNQLAKEGTFFLVPKNDVESARANVKIDPRDWLAVARGVDADYALRADVLEFDAKIREGYSKKKVFDSQLAEERGEDEGMTERVYKVKSLQASVRVDLEFIELLSKESTSAVAFAEKTIEADEQKGAIHLPPKLRLLEDLTNEAFAEFFKKYK